MTSFRRAAPRPAHRAAARRVGGGRRLRHAQAHRPRHRRRRRRCQRQAGRAGRARAARGRAGRRARGRALAEPPQPRDPPRSRSARCTRWSPAAACSPRATPAMKVRDLQARLAAARVVLRPRHRQYDAATVEAVRGFQDKREIPVTGKVDQRTLDRLHGMTTEPSRDAMGLHNVPGAARRALPDRPGAVHRQDQPTLRWVVDGKVLKTVDVRFGVVVHADPRGRLLGLPQEPRPRVPALRLGDAVRDVLLRRPGGALLVGLRGHRLRRRLARLRQRARLRRGRLALRPGRRSATRSSSTGASRS